MNISLILVSINYILPSIIMFEIIGHIFGLVEPTGPIGAPCTDLGACWTHFATCMTNFAPIWSNFACLIYFAARWSYLGAFCAFCGIVVVAMSLKSTYHCMKQFLTNLIIYY